MNGIWNTLLNIDIFNNKNVQSRNAILLVSGSNLKVNINNWNELNKMEILNNLNLVNLNVSWIL